MSRPEVRLRGKNFDFAVPLGNGIAVVTGGSARWEEITRPQRTAITQFQGNEPIKVDVPVLFDGWPDRSIQDHVDQVLGICRGDDGNRPPDFEATGPIPYSGTRFVMLEVPEWGEGLRADTGTGIRGALVRQALTLHLAQFIDPDTIRFHKRRHHGTGDGGTQAPMTITLKHEQTLLQIAAQYLGNANLAGQIGKLNDIRDTRKKLPAGRKIKLPGGVT